MDCPFRKVPPFKYWIRLVWQLRSIKFHWLPWSCRKDGPVPPGRSRYSTGPLLRSWSDTTLCRLIVCTAGTSRRWKAGGLRRSKARRRRRWKARDIRCLGKFRGFLWLNTAIRIFTRCGPSLVDIRDSRRDEVTHGIFFDLHYAEECFR